MNPDYEFKCLLEKKIIEQNIDDNNNNNNNNNINQEIERVIDNFVSLNIELKDDNETSLKQTIKFGEFQPKNYNIDNNNSISIQRANGQFKSVELPLNHENELKIILLLSELPNNVRSNVIHLNDFRRIERETNIIKNQLKLILHDNNGNNSEKIINYEQSLNNLSDLQIIIINNNEQYQRIIKLCYLTLNNYKEKDMFDREVEHDNINYCKIKIAIKDDNQTDVKLFYSWELLKYCKNNKDFYKALKDYYKDEKIILNEITELNAVQNDQVGKKNKQKYIFIINLEYINEYKIEIYKNTKNCIEGFICDCKCDCWKYCRCGLDCWKHCDCDCDCWKDCCLPCIIFLGKVMRFFFQIGDIFISLVLLGIFIETITLMITALQAFCSEAWWIIAIIGFIIIFYAMNYFMIFPLAFQFYEAFKLRYIRNKNPFIRIVRIILKIIVYKGDIDAINKRVENISDLAFFGCFILYVIGFIIYNNWPYLVETLNLFILIIMPILKLICVFFYTCYLGYIRIINRYFCCEKCKNCCNCCKNSDNYEYCCKIKKLDVFLDFDSFKKKIEFNEPNESYEELDPSSLLMYGQGEDEAYSIVTTHLKIFIFIVFILLVLIFYTIKFGGFYTIYFLLFFFLIIFPLSISISECNICSCCMDVINYGKILDKFKGLKYWIYLMRFLINFLIIGLCLISAINNDLEDEGIDKRLGDEELFNQIHVEDFTEQLIYRKYLTNPMCNTQVHYLNFIQLVALAQAAYINKDDDINIAKDIFYSSTIFKYSIPKIKSMKFLTKENDNIVILRTDFENANGRKLIVFSIRGSTSFRDWWLDLEMFSPSAVFTLIKRIPLILKEDSYTSEAIKWLLTLPLKGLEDISLLKRYSETVYSKVDNIIKENNNTDFIFVGHSLGGGLSKYVATHYQVQSFSVSGPGVSPLEYKHKEINGYNKYFKSSFIDIIPDMDIVPRLEISNANKYRVLCGKGPFTCHSVDRTLCMMGIMCQQEEYTKQLCLSMPGIQNEEYALMKELKNGEGFCENFILNNESEKYKCKSAKVSNEDSKCCYVHLKYPKPLNTINEDYKCLQFREDEKNIYIEGIKRKYPRDSEFELECY